MKCRDLAGDPLGPPPRSRGWPHPPTPGGRHYSAPPTIVLIGASKPVNSQCPRAIGIFPISLRPSKKSAIRKGSTLLPTPWVHPLVPGGRHYSPPPTIVLIGASNPVSSQCPKAIGIFPISLRPSKKSAIRKGLPLASCRRAYSAMASSTRYLPVI
jgi:hypothetical protein